MTIFFCDLDKTLIHSYKVARKGDICVEIFKKDLSFMSREAYLLLKEIAQKCIFIPVTTRSLEQYRRIDLGITPKYALAAQGTILLIDGEPDVNWAHPSPISGLFAELTKIEEQENLLHDIRLIDDFFISAKLNQPGTTPKFLQTAVAPHKLYAINSRVYIMPESVCKGVSVKRFLARFAKRLNPRQIICAGDSVLDIPMFEFADTAFHPSSLAVNRDNSQAIDDENFPVEMLKHCLKML